MTEGFDRSALKANQKKADRYHAGLTPEIEGYLAGRGIDKHMASLFRLGRCDDIHEGRLAIPYLRPSGTIWFNYRSLEGSKPKYMASGARHLYNTAALRLPCTWAWTRPDCDN